MVSAAKAFAKEPPRRPLTDLDAIIEDFQWRYVDRKKTDQVIKYCAKSKKFAEAVRRAVEARDKNGKHHNHQSKVDITARRKFGASIVAHKKDIMRIRDHVNDIDVYTEYFRPFDALHDLFDHIKPFGIGPVTVYDVAVRVGAFLEIEPESVYMHAGVKQGLAALEDALGRRASSAKYAAALHGAHRLPRVPMYLFPKPLRKLRPDDVEDILCTYREVFQSWD